MKKAQSLSIENCKSYFWCY